MASLEEIRAIGAESTRNIERLASRQNARKVNKILSHLEGVKQAVHVVGREGQARAEAAFASHDQPGGHRVVGETQDTDYVISLEGPVPHVIEYGRHGYTRQSDGAKIGPMQGLYIIHRAF